MSSSSEPLLYRNGVVKFMGREIESDALGPVRGNWINELNKFGDQWLIVFDDFMVLGDQVKEHDSRKYRKSLAGVEFLGTRYNTLADVDDARVKVFINGREWVDQSLIKQIKSRLRYKIKGMS